MTAPQAVSVGSSHFARRQHWLDPFIAEVDVALQVLAGQAAAARPNPAGAVKPDVGHELTAPEATHAAGLMRVNHVGEVCAQALYRGQAAASKDPSSAALFIARRPTRLIIWPGVNNGCASLTVGPVC